MGGLLAELLAPSGYLCLQHHRNERKALDLVPKGRRRVSLAMLNRVVSGDRCSGRIKWALKWRTRSKVLSHFSALLGQM